MGGPSIRLSLRYAASRYRLVSLELTWFLASWQQGSEGDLLWDSHFLSTLAYNADCQSRKASPQCSPQRSSRSRYP